MDDLHVYSVGILSKWQTYRWHGIRQWLRFMRRQIKKRNWRAMKNSLNGYLAEPIREWPPGVIRCGSGWTKKRAIRSWQRQYRKAQNGH